MGKEGKMPKKWRPNVIRMKETKDQAKGYGCVKDSDNVSYPFPCPLSNLRNCPKA